MPLVFALALGRRTALFRLEEYEAALETFEAGAKADPSNGTLKTWVRKCQAELEGERFFWGEAEILCAAVGG